jgi:hypothetical protein
MSTNVICPSNDADKPGKGFFGNAITSTENSGAWVSFDVLYAEMGGSAIGSFVTRTLSPTLRGRMALASQHTSLGSGRNPQNEGGVVKTSSQLPLSFTAGTCRNNQHRSQRPYLHRTNLHDKLKRLVSLSTSC